MKAFTLLVVFSFTMSAMAQKKEDKLLEEAKGYYEQGMAQVDAGKPQNAIPYFDKAIATKADEYIFWYNRGIAKNRLKLYEEALSDFNETLNLMPGYKKAYFSRGLTRRRLTDYKGAMWDYNCAVTLDPAYAEAFYSRAEVYELFRKKDSACADYKKAFDAGFKRAQDKITKCRDTARPMIPLNVVLKLSKPAGNDKYGFAHDYPVKVGSGPDGGAGNQKAYLDLLRDAKGRPISYQSIGTCCAYKSEYGLFGMGTLDRYSITYLDAEGKETKAIVYLSFYDYEEPQILPGFKTVGQN